MANPNAFPMTKPVNRLRGSLPKIGIRPCIDGRRRGVRESLEEQTMQMAKPSRISFPTTCATAAGCRWNA